MENATSVARLSRDLAKAAKTLTDHEARFLVDTYYTMQDQRKRSSNQHRALSESGEPNEILGWFASQSETLEHQIKRALDKYTQNHIMGAWMRGVYGIGPIISAGLLANIKIERCPTVGNIWRFAGLDPSVKWCKGEMRPWNTSLKTLCWHTGQSFMKFSAREECFYGHRYLERKRYEVERNESGGNKETAKSLLDRFSPKTETHKHLSNGKLPPIQIDARARRWAVKLFLAHLHERWYEEHHGEPSPLPYPIAHLDHVHVISAVN